MFIYCSSQSDVFENALYIDPGDIDDSLLPIVIEPDDKKALKFETEVGRYGYDRINPCQYLDIIFRYRDPALLPIYFSILNSQNLHIYFKVSAIKLY